MFVLVKPSDNATEIVDLKKKDLESGTEVKVKRHCLQRHTFTAQIQKMIRANSAE